MEKTIKYKGYTILKDDYHIYVSSSDNQVVAMAEDKEERTDEELKAFVDNDLTMVLEHLKRRDEERKKEKGIIKYAKCTFDRLNGKIRDDDGSLEWHEDTFANAWSSVVNDPGHCALFHPKDVPGYGVPVNPDVSREEFEANPAVYGVCLYYGWRGVVAE